MRMNRVGFVSSDTDLEQITSLFRLLSDKTRLTIVTLLASEERNVTALCRELALPQPTVSHHLGLLKMNNVIIGRRKGKQVIYGVAGRVERAGEMLRILLDNFSVQIAPRKA